MSKVNYFKSAKSNKKTKRQIDKTILWILWITKKNAQKNRWCSYACF